MAQNIKHTDNKATFELARTLLLEGESMEIRVGGQSMLPFFRSGSVVRLRPLRSTDIKKGRVVLGETHSGTYVIHRIIRVADSEVILLGDGNVRGTETIPLEKLYGTVDCGRVHLMLAHIWLWMRPVRRYPLWFLRRISQK